MNEKKKWYYEKLASRTVKALTNNGMNAYYAATSKEAKKMALDMISDDAKIGIGGSLTLREIGLLEDFKSKKYQLLISLEEVPADVLTAQRRLALTSDFYFTGTNAITVDGRLINIDAIGNRVASMVFGPKHVIVIAGVNKIARNLEEGLARAREEAGVMNAKKLKRKTPCTKTGKCENCSSSERICNITVIIDKKPRMTDMTVIIVGEELGF